MERMNFVKNGVLRLPPGFRFHPTDEELVVQYLNRKVQSSPMPAHIIPEIDVCKSDPWDLPGEPEKERFFFSTREIKYPNGSRSNRATGSGYWKATGLDKQIVGSQTNQVVGMKKTLVFYRGKPPTGVRTDWIMHEYRLATPTGGAPQVKNPIPGMEDWVLCRIFLKKRGSNAKKNEKEGDPVQVENGDDKVEEAKPNQKQMPVFYEFLAMTKERTGDLNLVPGSSSTGSSGITTNACGCGTRETDEHEESCTDCNDVSTFKRTPWP